MISTFFLNIRFVGKFGGEGGIRTPDRVLPYTRFPGVRLKPLIHLSVEGAHCSKDLFNHQAHSGLFCQKIPPYRPFSASGLHYQNGHRQANP